MSMSPSALNQSLLYFLTEEVVAPRPTEWEVSLHTGDPGPNGTDNEVDDSAYARRPVEFVVDDSDPEAPFATNSIDVVFAAAVGAYVVTHVVVWGDSAVLDVQQLVAARTVGVGGQAQFAEGDILIGGISR